MNRIYPTLKGGLDFPFETRIEVQLTTCGETWFSGVGARDAVLLDADSPFGREVDQDQIVCWRHPEPQPSREPVTE